MPNSSKGRNFQKEEAEILARKMLAAEPDNPDVLNGLGLILMAQGQFGEASHHFRLALEKFSDNLEYRENFMRALVASARQSVKAGEYADAIQALRLAVEESPERLDVHCHLSFVLSQSGLHDEGLKIAEKALKIDDGHPHPHDVKGLALLGIERMQDSIVSFRKALEIDPVFLSAHNNLGNALLKLKDHEGAIEHFRCVVKNDPENAQAFNNLGLVLADQAHFIKAEEKLRRAIAISPEFAEAHFNLSRVLLMQGNYQEGWQENEWRWKCQNFPSTWRDFPYARWRGEPVRDKTVLVWSEQGIGDEIMFASTIPDLLADGAKLILECGERLVPLFDRSFNGAVVVSRKNPPNKLILQAQVDYQLPMASLCNYYRNSREAFHKASGSYLYSDPNRKVKLKNRYLRPEKKPLIGICWRSGNPIAGEERSAPLEHWDKILLQPNCIFVSLQYGEVKADLEAVKKRTGVEVYHDEKIDPLTDAEDWFAQVAAMDLVISVDNSTIQVSGSQDIPTWVLLSALPEWRFGINGNGHDWHSSARVYRQTNESDWKPVFNYLVRDLGNWLANTEFNL